MITGVDEITLRFEISQLTTEDSGDRIGVRQHRGRADELYGAVVGGGDSLSWVLATERLP